MTNCDELKADIKINANSFWPNISPFASVCRRLPSPLTDDTELATKELDKFNKKENKPP